VIQGQHLQGTQLANFEAGCKIGQTGDRRIIPGTGAPGSTKRQCVDYYWRGGQHWRDLSRAFRTVANQSPSPLLRASFLAGRKVIPGMKVGGTGASLAPPLALCGANPPSGSGIPDGRQSGLDVTFARNHVVPACWHLGKSSVRTSLQILKYGSFGFCFSSQIVSKQTTLTAA